MKSALNRLPSHMFAPTQTSGLNYRTTPYRVPRRVLIWIGWRRIIRARRTLLALSIWLALGVGCLFLPGGLRVLAAVPLLLVAIAPLNVLQLCAKSVDAEPQLTDEKTLEFSRTHLAFTGPDWRNEMTWTRFKGLSEDPAHFFLDLRRSNLAVVIPKSAFTPDLEQAFRECAKDIRTT